jgi:hypothetical protein
VRRRLTLATVGAVAAVAVAITIPVMSLRGHEPTATANAATALPEAGAAAAAQPGGWPDAACWHVTSTYVRGGRTYRRDIWIAHHGASVLRDTGLDNVGPDGQAQVLPADENFSAGGTALTWDQVYALPTDPTHLKSALQSDRKGAGKDSVTELFVALDDLLRETPASPALRKSLYDIAAKIPGVQITGRVTDGAGRTGTAVEYGGETYVIDRTNGQLLADKDSGWTSTYVSQGPATVAPKLATK